jgi:hypothetical protein
MITKDLCTYSIRILRQDQILRDHELPDLVEYDVKSEISGFHTPAADGASAWDEGDAPAG